MILYLPFFVGKDKIPTIFKCEVSIVKPKPLYLLKYEDLININSPLELKGECYCLQHFCYNLSSCKDKLLRLIKFEAERLYSKNNEFSVSDYVKNKYDSIKIVE